MARAEASPPVQYEGPLTRSSPASPNYSRSGNYGDPTLATRAKGELLLDAMIEDLSEQMMVFVAEREGVSDEMPDSMPSALR